MVLSALGPLTGCKQFAGHLIESALGSNVRTITERRPNGKVLDTRSWTLDYNEDITFTSDLPGVLVVVNGQTLGACPVIFHRPSAKLDIEEHGFYRGDDYWRVKYREEDEHGQPCRELISETYLRTERRGPTRWIDHRTVTPNLPPLTITWLRDGEPLGETVLDMPSDSFTLKSPPPDADPVLLDALNQLTWNRDITDPAVPGHAQGQRALHWPDAAVPPPRPTNPRAGVFGVRLWPAWALAFRAA